MSAVAMPLRARRARWSRFARAWIALVVPALLLAAFVATNVDASLGQRSLERRWEAMLDAAAASPGETARATVAPGDPVARIRVPAMNLDAIVVEGTGSMRHGPAHASPSPLPGEEGVSVILGNRLGFGSFFAGIGRLEPGDEIHVETLSGVLTFRVQTVDRVPAARLDLSGRAGDQRSLALVGSARRWGGDMRIVVRSNLAGSS